MRLVSVRGAGVVAGVFALSLLVCLTVAGQEPGKKTSGGAVISGTVTDQTQAVVTGAQVVLKDWLETDAGCESAAGK